MDQVLSSSTNVGITVVAARALGRPAFGAFGLAFAFYLFALGAARGLVTEPLLSRPGHAEGDRYRNTAAAVSGSMMLLGMSVAVVLVGLGAIVGAEAGKAILVLATVLPGVFVQDAWRYIFVTAQRPKLAVANELVWVACMAGAVTASSAVATLTPSLAILCWGLSGMVAAVAGCAQARALPSLGDGWRWIYQQIDLGARYCLEFLMSSGATHAATIGLGVISGLGAVGAVRAVQTLFSPINLLFSAIMFTLVPEASRRGGERARMRSTMYVASSGLALATIGWTAVVMWAPADVGRQVLGATWEVARGLAFPTGLSVLAGGVAGGAIAGLRALGAARESLRARAVALPLVIAGPLLGAAFADATGFSYGLALAVAAGATSFWWQFQRADS